MPAVSAALAAWRKTCTEKENDLPEKDEPGNLGCGPEACKAEGDDDDAMPPLLGTIAFGTAGEPALGLDDPLLAAIAAAWECKQASSLDLDPDLSMDTLGNSAVGSTGDDVSQHCGAGDAVNKHCSTEHDDIDSASTSRMVRPADVDKLFTAAARQVMETSFNETLFRVASFSFYEGLLDRSIHARATKEVLVGKIVLMFSQDLPAKLLDEAQRLWLADCIAAAYLEAAPNWHVV